MTLAPATVAFSVVADDSDLLAQVEAFIAGDARARVLPEWLEASFEREFRTRAGMALARGAVKTAVIYNLLVLGDLLLTPDVVALACAVRIAVVTPAMLIAAAALRRSPPRWARELAAALLPILMIGHILTFYLMSRAPTASNYLYFVPLAAFSANVTLRLDYRAARWAALAALGLLAGALAISMRAPVGFGALQCLALTVAALVTLDGDRERDLEVRLSYARGLRDRLYVAATAREARRDALTGLANRRGLEEAATAIWREGVEASPISAILFDVDHFKAFNDLYGHQAGDLCLRRIAECALATLAGSGGVIARYGGEEFLFVAPRLTLEAAAQMADLCGGRF